MYRPELTLRGLARWVSVIAFSRIVDSSPISVKLEHLTVRPRLENLEVNRSA